jgi:imidazolonepropionase-like amidohydrolase
MLVAVHALGARGGHCDSNGYPYQLFGPEPGIADGIAAGPDAFRDSVRFQVKYGADVIKVCATGGVLSLTDEVDTPQITQDEMNAIVDEAHRLRKKTAAHAHGAGRGEGRHPRRHRLHRARLVPGRGGAAADEGARDVPGPHPARRRIRGGKAVERHYPPEIAAKAKAAETARSATFRRALAMGVKIAFGTDSAVSPHGRNAEEFSLLVAHGMSPAAALRTVRDRGHPARPRTSRSARSRWARTRT